TSGQHIGPMADELPYAVTKGALHQMTASVADALIDTGIVANCINPGPVDTGYARGTAHADVAEKFPAVPGERPATSPTSSSSSSATRANGYRDR
ncbi:MAG: putative oxidoreductase, partial [Actinomycetia bacterium]|nr:putative oxidoreductase [Actinomycetes bacterium]